jgi:DNA-binding transcriptional regulator PaaX
MRLTSAGKLKALGGRDPVAQWEREWDGRWQCVVFDVPERRRAARLRLRRLLRQCHFGRLQGSLWITPAPLDPIIRELSDSEEDPTGLIILPSGPLGKESESKIVAKAWNFESINAEHRTYLDFLKKNPLREVSLEKTMRWLFVERQNWIRVASKDPFLPRALWPEDYLGYEVWDRRRSVMTQVEMRRNSDISFLNSKGSVT